MILDEETQLMLAHEGFIRRAAATGLPFMLKGSYVTRQYFPDTIPRIPADLDWLCLEHFPDETTARTRLNAWTTETTRTELKDGVRFRDFKENEFWRMIDYAMADDFPTVNTDLKCWVDGAELEFLMDVSFNLPIDQAAVPLLYKPLQGEPFIVPFTTPLALQVAWKIHQTLVRPRFKDLFDLIYLVQHADFTPTTLQQSFAALLAECQADGTNRGKIKTFLTYKLKDLFLPNDIKSVWDKWRHDAAGKPFSRQGFVIPYSDRAEQLTDTSLLPEKLDDFLALFRNTMEQVGFVPELAAGIPENKVRDGITQTIPPVVAPAASAPTAATWLQKIRNFFQ